MSSKPSPLSRPNLHHAYLQRFNPSPSSWLLQTLSLLFSCQGKQSHLNFPLSLVNFELNLLSIRKETPNTAAIQNKTKNG